MQTLTGGTLVAWGAYQNYVKLSLYLLQDCPHAHALFSMACCSSFRSLQIYFQLLDPAADLLHSNNQDKGIFTWKPPREEDLGQSVDNL